MPEQLLMTEFGWCLCQPVLRLVGCLEYRDHQPPTCDQRSAMPFVAHFEALLSTREQVGFWEEPNQQHQPWLATCQSHSLNPKQSLTGFGTHV
jgi:hypothetical protein